ncbi:hypothetical protein FLK61_26590 [Paenalkalicoccus suaedae]|uniref:Bacterial Ig-like domain-containing protein n=1 Tax=Paenalkalicoccus suaedae TaxID=2592382 RepID=A0A859FBB8_9BACI|nr:immunoglobulin-like domain-containing protein [Paenalkalicoccus suaedae]QKS70327.1 hypothetical protein FLK61_26590 [Paenalkalicoccus suaedae]
MKTSLLLVLCGLVVATLIFLNRPVSDDVVREELLVDRENDLPEEVMEQGVAVAITTDATTVDRGEHVEVTVQNNGASQISTHDTGLSLETVDSDNSWRPLEEDPIIQDVLRTIEPGEEEVFDMRLPNSAGAGVARVVLSFTTMEGDEHQLATSIYVN